MTNRITFKHMLLLPTQPCLLHGVYYTNTMDEIGPFTVILGGLLRTLIVCTRAPAARKA